MKIKIYDSDSPETKRIAEFFKDSKDCVHKKRKKTSFECVISGLNDPKVAVVEDIFNRIEYGYKLEVVFDDHPYVEYVVYMPVRKGVEPDTYVCGRYSFTIFYDRRAETFFYDRRAETFKLEVTSGDPIILSETRLNELKINK